MAPATEKALSCRQISLLTSSHRCPASHFFLSVVLPKKRWVRVPAYRCHLCRRAYTNTYSMTHSVVRVSVSVIFTKKTNNNLWNVTVRCRYRGWCICIESGRVPEVNFTRLFYRILVLYHFLLFCLNSLHTGSKQMVEDCQKYFGCLPVSLRIDIHTVRFLDRFKASENSLCNVFREQASRHMSEFSSKFGA